MMTSTRRQKILPPERHDDLVGQRGGIITIPRRVTCETVEGCGSSSNRRLTKLLLNVNVERSSGPVQVVMVPENTVVDLIKAVVEVYVKEKRRPLLSHTDVNKFQLHYSPFSLESLKPDEKLINLGSRNFFLCSKTSAAASSLCSQGADKISCLQLTLLDCIL